MRRAAGKDESEGNDRPPRPNKEVIPKVIVNRQPGTFSIVGPTWNGAKVSTGFE
jgi:hypothetical protein